MTDKFMPDIVNPSLNEKGIRILTFVNAILGDARTKQVAHERQAIVRYLNRHYTGRYHFITRSQARDFAALFDDVNEELRRIAFADHEGPLFDDDFSDYPETIEEQELTVDEFAEFAIGLWRQTRERDIDRSLAMRISRRLGL